MQKKVRRGKTEFKPATPCFDRVYPERSRRAQHDKCLVTLSGVEGVKRTRGDANPSADGQNMDEVGGLSMTNALVTLSGVEG